MANYNRNPDDIAAVSLAIENSLKRKSEDGQAKLCGVAYDAIEQLTALIRYHCAKQPDIINLWGEIKKAMFKENNRWYLFRTTTAKADPNMASPDASRNLAKKLADIEDDDDLTQEQKKTKSVEAFKDSIDLVILFNSVMKGLQDGKSEDRKLCAQMLGLFEEKKQEVGQTTIELNIIVREEDKHLLSGNVSVKGLLE